MGVLPHRRLDPRDRFGRIYDDENGKLVVAASIVTGALAIFPLLISLIPGATSWLWLIALPVAAIAVAWMVFLVPWLNEHVGNIEIGAGVALIAGVVVAGSGIATGVLALRAKPG